MGHHDLATVRSRAYTSCAADSNSDVAVGVEMRFGRVESHSHPHDLIGTEGALPGNGRRDGSGRSLERDEERVAFDIDFVSAMHLERFAEETSMLRTYVAVKVTVPRGSPLSIVGDVTGPPRRA